MNNCERTLAALNYQPYDRLPIVHFGFWHETLVKWVDEGHLRKDDIRDWGQDAARTRMGFDFEWGCPQGIHAGLKPDFERQVIEERPDGTTLVRNSDGVIIQVRPDATSIPAEVDHLLKTRKDWEEHFLPRLQFDASRVPDATRFDGNDFTQPRGLYCGSLFGMIRNWVGVTGAAYIYADDEPLFDEMIDTVGDLAFRCVQATLDQGTRFDFGHFWEDICFKNGPLVIPDVFHEKVGPHYRRITEALNRRGISICSLDCDGMIDALIPTWFENGVNTMFPIEVGTWNASIAPWRERYGRELRGVGGMNKIAFARDRAAVDEEIERLRPLVDLGGYIPCPDHRIPPDASYSNVCYYVERMRKVFG